MVGAMNLGVTVQASAAEQETVAEIVVDVLASIGFAGMSFGGMTLLAEQWWELGQQGLMIAAMRPVTQGAVFAGRGMFPQERSALVVVTVVASLINGRSLQQKVIAAVVRIMATAAAHFTKT